MVGVDVSLSSHTLFVKAVETKLIDQYYEACEEFEALNRPALQNF